MSRFLGNSNLSEPGVIFLNDIRFFVIRIFSKSQGVSAPLSSITIQTGVGAARVVSEQLPAAIDPLARPPKSKSAKKADSPTKQKSLSTFPSSPHCTACIGSVSVRSRLEQHHIHRR